MPDVFNPSFPPDEGAKVSFQPKPIKHTFQDGYVQRAGRGAKADQRPHDVKWTNATKLEAEYIIGFLEERQGYISFWWTPNGESAQRLFTCEEFDYAWKKGNNCDITATFEEVAG